MTRPKVGVGIITVQSRDISPNFLNMITMPTHFYVHTDTERRGPAHARNECIKNLYDAGCEYFFLFDDDSYPQVPGWQDYLIKESERTGIHCFGYPDVFGYDPVAFSDGMVYWRWCTGAFNFMTRKLIDTIGYFNPEYSRYGYEDVAYLYRARQSGIGGARKDADPSPMKITSYIRNEDVFRMPKRSSGPFANMSQQDKDLAILENKAIFDRETTSNKLYYDYDKSQT
jgi:hypothetical protein